MAGFCDSLRYLPCCAARGKANEITARKRIGVFYYASAALRARRCPPKVLPSYENRFMARVRMDKWLWAARFFKTRALAARACELGRIESNGQQAKASREVRAGDLLQVKNDGGDFQVQVVLLSELRGPAAVAQTLYRETEASREL